MADFPLNSVAATDDIELLLATYRRLAAMDLPALRSLAGELTRISQESLASAGLGADPAAQARAGRDARRAEAAQAVLGSAKAEG